MMEDYPGQNKGINATNYAVQPGRGDYDRPSMKQDQHQEHNMPASEYVGVKMPIPQKESNGSYSLDQAPKD